MQVKYHINFQRNLSGIYDFESLEHLLLELIFWKNRLYYQWFPNRNIFNNFWETFWPLLGLNQTSNRCKHLLYKKKILIRRCNQKSCQKYIKILCFYKKKDFFKNSVKFYSQSPIKWHFLLIFLNEVKVV